MDIYYQHFQHLHLVWEGNGLLTVYRRTVSVAGKSLNLPHTKMNTHSHRTMYHCIGDWQGDQDYILFMTP